MTFPQINRLTVKVLIKFSMEFNKLTPKFTWKIKGPTKPKEKNREASLA